MSIHCEVILRRSAASERLTEPSWMRSHESPGFLRRMLTALSGTLKRGILGKSSHDHMKQFTGSDAYWDHVLAAQLGWAQKLPPKLNPKPIYEPVHGWTDRQLHDYLARNPNYKPTYEAELLKHQRHAPAHH